MVEPGDIVIALGAGDINASARELLADAHEGGEPRDAPPTVACGKRRVRTPQPPSSLDLPPASAPSAQRRAVRASRASSAPRGRRSASRSSLGASLGRGLGRAPARDDEPALRRDARSTSTAPRRAGAPRPSPPRAASRLGANIFALDLDARPRPHPRRSRGSPRRRWRAGCRGRILVQVTERKPAAIVALGETYLATADGEPFKRLEPGDPIDLPLVTGLRPESLADDREGTMRTIRRAIDLAAEYERGPLAQRAPLEEVHVDADGAFAIVVGRGAMQLVLGRAAVPPQARSGRARRGRARQARGEGRRHHARQRRPPRARRRPDALSLLALRRIPARRTCRRRRPPRRRTAGRRSRRSWRRPPRTRRSAPV